MMQKTTEKRLSFLNSRGYYITIIVALLGVIVDYSLTIQGLSIGYQETRPYYWMQTIGLFGIITAIFYIMNPLSKKVASITALLFAIAMPLLPIISNIMMLTVGWSPLITS